MSYRGWESAGDSGGSHPFDPLNVPHGSKVSKCLALMFCFSSPFGRRERAAPSVEAGAAPVPPPLAAASSATAQPCIVLVKSPGEEAGAGEARTAPRAEPETDTASYSSSASGCSATTISNSSSGCDAGGAVDEDDEGRVGILAGGKSVDGSSPTPPLASRRGAPAPLPPLAACASSSASSLLESLTASSASPSSPAAPSPSPSAPGPGPRFKLLREGDVQLCYLNHTRTVISKILSSKFLRRWETHRLYLNDACISSKTK